MHIFKTPKFPELHCRNPWGWVVTTVVLVTAGCMVTTAGGGVANWVIETSTLPNAATWFCKKVLKEWLSKNIISKKYWLGIHVYL